MRLVLVILCSLLISGCAGVSTMPGSTLHVDGCSDGVEGLSPGKFNLTSSDIEKVHGKPDKIISTENGEQWYYPNGLKWRGVVVWIVVPIPLILPVGHDYHVVNFSNGLCTSEEFQFDENDHGFACGLFWGDQYGSAFQCGTR